MKVVIYPTNIKGNMVAPPSKSMMQRACAAALIRGGNVILNNYGKSDDDKVALNIIQQLGSIITIIDDYKLEISTEKLITSYGLKPRDNSFFFNESGLSARMFTPIIALIEGQFELNGSGSLLNRPFDFIQDNLTKLGVVVKSENGHLPLIIQGALVPNDIEVNASVSSQFITGLLMAYSAAKATGKTIVVNDLKSKPYIDLTLKVMEDFGLVIPENKNHQQFYFRESSIPKPNNDVLNYTIEGDWSNASFFMVAAAIAGAVSITGLNVFSTQADKRILEVLQQSGCGLSITENEIYVSKQQLIPFQFDATHCPDLFPPLVALAVYCDGMSIIQGVHRLVSKESNRKESLVHNYLRLGADITIADDYMIIHGGKPLQSATVNSFHDHRIAMSLAVAALCAKDKIVIEDATCVTKSYPDFFETLQSLIVS